MSLATRLIDALQERAQALTAQPQLAAGGRVRSVVLVGSLARDDFNEGGSDIDLLIVHEHGEQPAAALGAVAGLRAVIRHFGEPLLRLGGGTGRQKPFLVDCHFADAQTVARQPQWADPAGFLRENASRDVYLWLYAFDLQESAQTLYGDNPAAQVKAYAPEGYLRILARDLREELARLQSYGHPACPPEALINDWKQLAGRLITLLAVKHGCRSLQKREVYRIFNLKVPYFPGRDFSASLWAEYVYGTVFQERAEWLCRCERFCAGALELLG